MDKLFETNEPKIHSHIDDVLPDDHPMAFECLYCTDCSAMVHAGNNECMQTWVETGHGEFCFPYFVKRIMNIHDGQVMDFDYGLYTKEITE